MPSFDMGYIGMGYPSGPLLIWATLVSVTLQALFGWYGLRFRHSLDMGYIGMGYASGTLWIWATLVWVTLQALF
jgi:glycogen debranching enzyme